MPLYNPASSGSALTVKEVDGAPSDAATTTIEFPNGTLGIAAHVATYTPSAAGTTIVTKDEGSTLSSGVTTLDFVGAGVTASGAGATTTVTIPSGGGLAQSFIGTNSIGGTWGGVTGKREYMKKITLAATSHFQSIDVYVRPNTDNIIGLHVAILSDSAGAPNLLIAANPSPSGGIYLSNSSSMPGAGRWLTRPIAATLAAGDYWLAIMFDTAITDLANDGSSGTNDQFFTSSLNTISGAYPTAFAITSTSTPIYSIRASILA